MEEVYKVIIDNAKASNNLCGLTLHKISRTSNLPAEETRQILKDLCESRLVREREGIHAKLYFAVPKNKPGAGPTRSLFSNKS